MGLSKKLPPPLDRFIINDKGEIYNNKGKKISLSKYKQGYPVLRLKINGVTKAYKVHRLVAEAFIPKIPNKTIVNHKDGNKCNNNVQNLEWTNYLENNIHAIEIGIGLRAKGVDCFNSKLSNDAVLDIFNSKLKPSELSKKYNIHKQQVYSIRTGKTWNHITNIPKAVKKIYNGKYK